MFLHLKPVLSKGEGLGSLAFLPGHSHPVPSLPQAKVVPRDGGGGGPGLHCSCPKAPHCLSRAFPPGTCSGWGGRHHNSLQSCREKLVSQRKGESFPSPAWGARSCAFIRALPALLVGSDAHACRAPWARALCCPGRRAVQGGALLQQVSSWPFRHVSWDTQKKLPQGAQR